MTRLRATFEPRQMVRVFLPREHGSWSLALEPVALGLIAAPSAAGVALSIAVSAGFFLRRPIKLVGSAGADPRRTLALGWIGLLAALAVTGVVLAARWSAPDRLWPLLVALPPGAAFVWFDTRGGGREEAAELAGAAAFAVVPAALAAVAGWSPAPALALAGVMVGRSVPTVMTLRAYLRRNKGQPVSSLPAFLASVVVLAAFILLVRAGLAPSTAVVFGVFMLARTAVLLGPRSPRLAASRLGLLEAVFGGALVIVVALSWPG